MLWYSLRCVVGASTEAPVLAQSPAPPPSSFNLYYSSFFLYNSPPIETLTFTLTFTYKHSPLLYLNQLQPLYPFSKELSSLSKRLQQNHILDNPTTKTPTQGYPGTLEFMSIENLKTFDPFAEADEDTGETKQSQNYIHIRIQQRNGRKTLTTVQGLPKKFDQKKILKVIKKKFACNGTIVTDNEMGEVIQLQGDQRKDVQEFLTDKKEGLELDVKTIKVHGF
ncbi:hypothetical protein V495_03386 [Pseudogymnoascus sp. VKM F-4514 (FW-929)]|nr:hypothetical protein V490_06069 [Pseudogymnoascus sp. VKM F-3557]KFY44563.1 hypothetical protein V495_03386 [Pseudogymnoascus sp. VKM F-4514 (FW-929)]KFY52080.1 hypothetical protein V497_08656 [Pseudogymnoascus sp. VKM F-4516 (FW-969)]